MVGGGGGGLQDFSVSPVPLGLIWVLSWVGLGWGWALVVLGLKGFGTGLDNLGDISDLVITPLNRPLSLDLLQWRSHLTGSSVYLKGHLHSRVSSSRRKT